MTIVAKYHNYLHETEIRICSLVIRLYQNKNYNYFYIDFCNDDIPNNDDYSELFWVDGKKLICKSENPIESGFKCQKHTDTKFTVFYFCF